MAMARDLQSVGDDMDGGDDDDPCHLGKANTGLVRQEINLQLKFLHFSMFYFFFLFKYLYE